MHAFLGGTRLLLRAEDGLVPLPSARLIRLEASEGRVEAIVQRGEEVGRVQVRASLAELEERLGARFVRLQRAHLVNVDWIERFRQLDDGREEAWLRDGSRIVASRAVSIDLRRAAL